MKTIAIAATCLTLLAGAGQAMAQMAHDHRYTGTLGQPSLAEGEVRKIDKEAGKITIKHGPIKNLDMPPMTMVFQMKDRAAMDKIKVGDKVRFSAEEKSGAYVVTTIETAK